MGPGLPNTKLYSIRHILVTNTVYHHTPSFPLLCGIRTYVGHAQRYEDSGQYSRICFGHTGMGPGRPFSAQCSGRHILFTDTVYQRTPSFPLLCAFRTAVGPSHRYKNSEKYSHISLVNLLWRARHTLVTSTV